MQTGFILIYFFIPVFSEGCCPGNRQRSETAVDHGDLPQQTTTLHYRAVEGELFTVPCLESVKPNTKARRVETGTCRTGNRGSSLNCGKEFVAEAKHSGNYTCDMGGGHMLFFLRVLKKDSVGCFQPEKSTLTLIIDQGGTIPCPGHPCSNKRNMSGAVWYKADKPLSKHRASCVQNGLLHLCHVYESDKGLYFCDRKMFEQGITWTLRRAVNVTVISASKTARGPPKVVIPENNTTNEVELGQPYTLTCKVFFPAEEIFSPDVMWFMNFGGKLEEMIQTEKPQMKTDTHENEVILTATIKEVTSQHLNLTYTCMAKNAVGNSTATIKLKKKVKVKWPTLVGYPFVALLLVTGVGVTLHVKWLEVQLIYRSHFQHGKNDKDEKEFDVFLSFVWSPPSEGVEEDVTLSFKTGSDTDDEACLPSMLNTQNGNDTQAPLEVLLPQVLEDQWGYRLFMLERDVVPGGAFTNDVVLAIQRSRMLICLLSADYLCDSNAVFILESGIQALLQNSTLKLLLIRTNRASTCSVQTEPPLPTVVQRALKVLPRLYWTSGKLSGQATYSFWRTLRKALPDHKSQSWFAA